MHPPETGVGESIVRRLESLRCIEASCGHVDDLGMRRVDACDVRAARGTVEARAVGGRFELCRRHGEITESIDRNDKPGHVRCGVNAPAHRAVAVDRQVAAVVDRVANLSAEASAFDHGLGHLMGPRCGNPPYATRGAPARSASPRMKPWHKRSADRSRPQNRRAVAKAAKGRSATNPDESSKGRPAW